MDIYELETKIYLLKDIKIVEIQNYLAYFIDSVLIEDKDFAKLHGTNKFKYYCFDSLYPLGTKGVYKKDNVYIFRLRTLDYKLAQYLYENLAKKRTQELQGLICKVKILKPRLLKKIYTLTPIIIKTEDGYWKNKYNLNYFEEHLKYNLVKKYNNLYGYKINNDFQLYNYLKFKNKVPISRNYKNISLLGDAIEIEVAENDIAQKLAWMAVGCGLGEMNSRGFGSINYQFY